MTPGTHDLTLSSQYHWRFDGPADGTLHSVETGDVNGDGIADLAIGFRQADFNGRADSGSVYVIYGSAVRAAGNYDLTVAASYNWRYDGAAAGDGLGHGLAVGDLNGDSLADLMAGASGADFNGRSGSGSLYVVYGSTTRVNGNYDLAVGANFQYRYDGATAGDACGQVPAVTA
jgi:hypothetical protein